MRTRRPRAAPVPRSAFAGFRFPPEVIVVAVRWYLRFGLSYRDVEEQLAERGVHVDHVTVYRRVQRFAPLLAEAAPAVPARRRRPLAGRCAGSSRPQRRGDCRRACLRPERSAGTPRAGRWGAGEPAAGRRVRRVGLGHLMPRGGRGFSSPRAGAIQQRPQQSFAGQPQPHQPWPGAARGAAHPAGWCLGGRPGGQVAFSTAVPFSPGFRSSGGA
jgi:hypothetical protein